MKLFLIGLPGSGKSTLGKKLASRLALPFLDLDTRLEEVAQQPIREIFAERGEAAFRELEREQLHRVIQQPAPLVLATGGGAPCFFDNMEVMNRAGVTLFLDVPIPIIVARMQGQQVTDRPLLHDLDEQHLVEAYTQKFEKRLPVYRQAHVTVSPGTDMEDVIALLRARN